MNPAKWTRDRFGAVTSYAFGNIALLNGRLIGFVASQGAYASELKPKRLWVRAGAKAGTEARHTEAGTEARHTDPISPVPSGTGVNKQRAVWCNEYVLRNSVEVWAGNITPGHTLASLIAALAPKRIDVT